MSLGQCNPQQKILWHLDRVAEWQKTGDTRPIIFEIDPSNRCNQDCPWCSFSKLRSESQAIMCFDSMIKLLTSLKEMGVKAVNWTGGGEPLVNPSLLDAIPIAKEMGFDQGMFTNGLLLNEKVRKVLLSNMTWVRVSLDGYNEESYAKSHGTSTKSWDIVINNIIKATHNPSRTCTFGLGFIITPDNYKGIEIVAELALRLGVDYIQFKPAVYRPGSKQMDANLIKNEIIPRVKNTQKLSTNGFNVMFTEYRFNDVMDAPLHGRTYKRCLSHHFQGAVGADSKVYICDHHKGEKEYELGDLNEKSMQEIWAGEQRKEVIKFLDSTDLSQCQSCCRNHELNKFLWHVNNVNKDMHPNHI